MSGMDEITDAIEEAVRDAEGGSYYPTVDFRRAARDSIAALCAVLRDRGLLLGPDGLVKAKPVQAWHAYNDRDGRSICNHPVSANDPCNNADKGTTRPHSFVLTPYEKTP